MDEKQIFELLLDVPSNPLRPRKARLIRSPRKQDDGSRLTIRGSEGAAPITLRSFGIRHLVHRAAEPRKQLPADWRAAPCPRGIDSDLVEEGIDRRPKLERAPPWRARGTPPSAHARARGSSPTSSTWASAFSSGQAFRASRRVGVGRTHHRRRRPSSPRCAGCWRRGDRRRGGSCRSPLSSKVHERLDTAHHHQEIVLAGEGRRRRPQDRAARLARAARPSAGRRRRTRRSSTLPSWPGLARPSTLVFAVVRTAAPVGSLTIEAWMAGPGPAMTMMWCPRSGASLNLTHSPARPDHAQRRAAQRIGILRPVGFSSIARSPPACRACRRARRRGHRIGRHAIRRARGL